MRRLVSLFSILLSLSACAAPSAGPAQAPPSQEVPAEEAPPEIDEAEDHVLLTLEAPLADGRTLTLEAFGKQVDDLTTGVREVRVYDGEDLIQTVQSREGYLASWGDGDLLPGESVSTYTQCWSPEDCMDALDLNFDGDTDLGLFAFVPNNTIPYYYWTWDAGTGQYQYACTLLGVEVHPEEGEISSGYKSGSAGSQWITEYYRPDVNGALYLDRVHRDTCDFEPESGMLDFDRGWADETWAPPEGMAPIRPDDSHWSLETDLTLLRREVPVLEIHGGTIRRFTEVWERVDGGLRLTSREEFYYDDQQP